MSWSWVYFTTHLMICHTVYLIGSLFILVTLASASHPGPAAKGFTCTTCKFFLDYVIGYLDQYENEEAILNQLRAICDVGPNFLRSTCNSYVNNNVPQLIEYLYDGFGDPEQACQFIGACELNFATMQNASIPLNCQLYHILSHFSAVLRHKQYNDIETYLLRLCAMSSQPEECFTYVHTQLPVILSSLNLFPKNVDQVCSLTKDCIDHHSVLHV